MPLEVRPEHGHLNPELAIGCSGPGLAYGVRTDLQEDIVSSLAAV